MSDFGILGLDRRNRDHSAVLSLPAQPTDEAPHQQPAIQPIRLCAALRPLHRNAAGMNDMGLDPVAV